MGFNWTGFLAIIAITFALSLVVQLALESLYRWTGFVVLEEAFKRRALGIGLRFPVAVVLSLWIAVTRQYDVLAQILKLAGHGDGAAAWDGYLISALAIAGGTAPFLALANQIEAWKERAKAVAIGARAAQAQTVRTDRVDSVVAKAEEKELRLDAGLPPAASRPADPSLTVGS